MNFRISFFALLLVLSFSCKQAPDLSQNIAQLEAELTEKTNLLHTARAEIASLKTTSEAKLIHSVYLKIKPEITPEEKAALITEIKKIANIEVLHDLQVGEFADLGDTRAMSDLAIVFQMGFNSEKDYQTYQNHELHLALKKAVGQYLSGPPVTHDFWLK